MNIKKIIKSQRVRHLLMRSCAWLPDKLMLSLQYYILLHRWPDLTHPKRFTEWIQYYKMKYRNPDMLRCVDKYDVRGYVEEKGCGEYLNELYQVCDNASEIDFEKLPQKFVIKTTNGGSGDNVMVVTDKDSLDTDAAIIKVNSWLKKNYSNTSREWAYSGASSHPRIIVEKYLENPSEDNLSANSLIDYKFFCFNGRVEFFKLDYDRYTRHSANYYDRNASLLDVTEGTFPQKEKTPPLPANISQMIEIAEKLAKEYPFVRIDLYNVGEKILFGEFTFYPGSGYFAFNPDKFDIEFSKYFKDIQIEHMGGVKY